jgi:hypothetical protein
MSSVGRLGELSSFQHHFMVTIITVIVVTITTILTLTHTTTPANIAHRHHHRSPNHLPPAHLPICPPAHLPTFPHQQQQRQQHLQGAWPAWRAERILRLWSSLFPNVSGKHGVLQRS